jgi:hypothetical protein
MPPRGTSGDAGATVIAFPASRIVRGANGEPPAHVPRSDGVSQAPHAG